MDGLQFRRVQIHTFFSMKTLRLSLLLTLASALVAPAAINNPAVQTFALAPSPDRTASYVFYIGTNANVPLVRIALTNASWASATGDLLIGIAKTNLFPGVTNFISATAMDANGVESLPCPEINYVPPRPPGLRLSATILESASPDGPWNEFTNLPPVEVAAADPQRYYRGKLTVNQQ